jgi:tRNA1(Val) A37 N6-methylase TrmN6
MLSKLNPDTDYNFVDIGAGTGKAMVLAAEYGFTNVRGAELVEELCRVAEGNFRRFQESFPETTFSIYHADALDFSFEERDAFFLLNAPFSEEVFRPFLDRVTEFSKRARHKIFFVYKNNNLRHMPSLAEFKRHCSDYLELDVSGNFFQIYVLGQEPLSQTSTS